MSKVVGGLIIFFLFLIIYQIVCTFYGNAVGITEEFKLFKKKKSSSKDDDCNSDCNAAILAQQNAGNIAYLKERMAEVQSMYKELQDLSGNVQNIQSQVNTIVQSQQEYANQTTGGEPPEITGAVEE